MLQVISLETHTSLDYAIKTCFTQDWRTRLRHNKINTWLYMYSVSSCSGTYLPPRGHILWLSIIILYVPQGLRIFLIKANYTLSLVSEQHNYVTRSASLQHLNPGFSRINIRKFCPTVIGCYYWNDLPLSICNLATRKCFKKALFQYYFAQC